MSGSIHALVRPATFLLAGAALASALLGPVTGRDAGGAASAAAMHTRSVSCAGVSFYPEDDRDGSGSKNRLRFRAYSTGGTGFYLCDPGLPNGAVVTKVQFTVRDAHAEWDLAYCALIRSSLVTTTAGDYQVLGGPFHTTDQPGTVRFTDRSIQFATIDNSRYGYWLQCWIGGPDYDLGIFGANVTYKISAANG